MQKTYEVIETGAHLLQSIKDIHSYLDELKAQGKKERLALDIETYICKEARDHYDLQYSLKKQKKKEKDEGILNIIQAPEYPMPYPCVNGQGIIEGRIRLIQIGLDPRQCNLQYILDLDKIYEDYCKNIYESDLVDILSFYKDIGALLEPLLNRASILGQFLKYEARNFIGHMDLYIEEMVDLWILSKIRHAGNKSNKEHNLAAIYKRQINETLFEELTGKDHDEYKKFKEEEQKSPWYNENLTEDQYQYAAEDVKLVWYVFDTLYTELEDWAQRNDTGVSGTGVFEVIKLECAIINKVALMENTGFPFSVEEYEAEAKGLIAQKMQEAQDAVNAVCYKKDEIVQKNKKKVTGKGKNRTVEHWVEETRVLQPYKLAYFGDIRELTGLGEKVLEKTSWKDLMFFRDAHWAVPYIIQFKKWQKLHGYFESSNPKSSGYLKVLGSDGFIRSSFNQLGAETGRFTGMAPNLQQVPGKPFVRRCFKAPRGFKFLIGDIPQAEPRLTAQEASDAFYLDIFQHNKDMHWETGKTLFGLPEKMDKKNPEHVEMRKHSKTVRLGKTYMMGFAKFIRELYIKSEGALDYAVRGKEGEKECRELSYRFDNLSPDVKEYIANLQKQIEEPVKANGGMLAYTGRPIHIAKSILGRTREFCLEPHERAHVKSNVDLWSYWHKVWVEDKYDEEGRLVKEGYWSANMNKCRSKIRDIAREAFNNRMQASQADGFKCGMLEAWRQLQLKVEEKVLQSLRDCVMINTIHDEAIYLVKEELAEVMAPILSEAYTKGFRRVLWDTSIPLDITFTICDSWANKDD